MKNPTKLEPEWEPMNRRKFIQKAPILLSLLLTACKPNTPQATLEPSWEVSNVNTLKNTELTDKDIKAVVGILVDVYKNNTVCNLETSSENTRKISQSIVDELIKNWFKLPEAINNQEKLTSFFLSKGYTFSISPMAIWPNKFVTNAIFAKIGSTQKKDLSWYILDGLPSGKWNATVYTIEKVLIPDFREMQQFPGPKMRFNAITITPSGSGDDIVLLFPENIKIFAKGSNLTPDQCEKLVLDNELSQVYFGQLIPKQLLWTEIQKFISTWGKKWTFHHLMETFSDYFSLNNDASFFAEYSRILLTPSDSYDMSSAIAFAATNLVLADQKPPLKIDQSNVTEFLRNIKPKDLEEIKTVVLESYKANIQAILNPAFIKALEWIKQKPSQTK